jgi:hypothetical protein
MSIKKPSELHLDYDGVRFKLRGKSNKGKTFVSRKGRYISTKELKRRELQRSKSLGANGVKSNYVAEVQDRPVQVNLKPKKVVEKSHWFVDFLMVIVNGFKRFAKYLFGR